MSEKPDLTLFDSLPPEEDEVRLRPDIERAVGEQTASASGMQLELVTDEHVPRPDARREAKLRPPRKSRNWRERMAADQPPPHQRVTPLGHDPILTVHRGGKHKTR